MAKTKRTATRRKRTSAAKPRELGTCQVEGCGRPGKVAQPAPRGPVVLCEKDAERAGLSLLDERVRVDRLDVAAPAGAKASARAELRRIERVHAALR
jgi:hypothetical protein